MNEAGSVDGRAGRDATGAIDRRGQSAARASANGPRVVPPSRQAEVRAAADRHSRRVRALRIALPVFAGLVAVAIVGYSWVEAHFLVGIDMKKVLFSKDGLTMVEPHLTGRAKDRSYDVAAVKAIQNLQNPKVVDLEGISGRIEMADASWAKIEASNGRYDGGADRLDLAGRVTVDTSQGWQAVGTNARVDLKSGDIVAERRLRITGRTAWIEADAVTMTDGGHYALFTGNVVMEVRPSDPDAAVPPPPAPAAPPAETR